MSIRVHNVHEREFACEAERVGALIDSLASPDDALWPRESWPPMRLQPCLRVDARGGHGPIGYWVEQYIPGQRVVFRFFAPRGFVGTHRFETAISKGHTALRHVVQMEAHGIAQLTWPLFIRPLHDALLEDCLAKAAVSLGVALDNPPARSAYVRFLRFLFKTLRRRRVAI
jgi:hypothetical protein